MRKQTTNMTRSLPQKSERFNDLTLRKDYFSVCLQTSGIQRMNFVHAVHQPFVMRLKWKFPDRLNPSYESYWSEEVGQSSARDKLLGIGLVGILEDQNIY